MISYKIIDSSIHSDRDDPALGLITEAQTNTMLHISKQNNIFQLPEIPEFYLFSIITNKEHKRALLKAEINNEKADSWII